MLLSKTKGVIAGIKIDYLAQYLLKLNKAIFDNKNDSLVNDIAAIL